MTQVELVTLSALIATPNFLIHSLLERCTGKCVTDNTSHRGKDDVILSQLLFFAFQFLLSSASS
jgi:hypothetical protein